MPCVEWTGDEYGRRRVVGVAHRFAPQSKLYEASAYVHMYVNMRLE